MGNIITKQNFLEPFVILLREGTIEDPYVDITEKIKTVSMPTGLEIGIAILREIPLYTQGVIAVRKSDGVALEEIRDSLTVPNETQFKVDYTNGRVYLDSANNNEEITYKYKGRGVILVTGERIIINNGQSIEYIKTLQDLVEEMESELLVGNLNNLLTIDKSYVVNALNEVFKMAKTPLNSTGVVVTDADLSKVETNILHIPNLSLYFKDRNDIGDMQIGVVICPEQTVEVPIPTEDGIVTYSVYIGIDGTVMFDKDMPSRMFNDKILLGFVCLDENGELAENFIFTSMQMATTDMMSRQEDLLFPNNGIFTGGQIEGNAGSLSLNKTKYYSVSEGVEPTEIDNPHLHYEEATALVPFYQIVPNGVLEIDELVLQTDIDPNNYSLDGVRTEVDDGMFTIQRFLALNNGFSLVVYGEEMFDTMDSALIAVNNLQFSTIDIPSTETNRIIIQKGCLDLTDATQCRIVYINNNSSGGSGSSAREQFSDRDFVLFNADNSSKQIKFDLSGLSANISRQLKPLNKSYTIADDADVQDLYDRTKIPYLTSGFVKTDNTDISVSGNTLTITDGKVYFQRINKVLPLNGNFTLPDITGYYTIYATNDNSDEIGITYLEEELNYYAKYMVRIFSGKLINGALDTSFYAEVPQLAQTTQLERTKFANNGDSAFGGHLEVVNSSNVSRELISYIKEGIDYKIDGDKNIVDFEKENPMSFRYVKQDNSFDDAVSFFSVNKYFNNGVLDNVDNGYFTIQRHIILCNGADIVEYGTAQYKNLTEAKNALASQEFLFPLGFKGRELNRLILQNNNNSVDLTDSNQCEIYYTNGSGSSLGGVGSAMNVDDLTTTVNDDGLLEIKGTSELVNSTTEDTRLVYTALKDASGAWYFNWNTGEAGHIIYSNNIAMPTRAKLMIRNYNDAVNDDNFNDATVLDLYSMVTGVKYQGKVFFYDDSND